MFIPSSYKNKKFALLGLGVTGASLLKHLNKFGIEPICWDDDEAKRKKFEGKGIKLLNLRDPIIWKELDILLISPGISFLYPTPHPVVKLARENFAEIDTDIERILGNDRVEVIVSENVTLEVVQSTIQSLVNKPDTKK